MDRCPVCEGPAVLWCDCTLADRECAQGHQWKPCYPHPDELCVISPGTAHPLSRECSCAKKVPLKRKLEGGEDTPVPKKARKEKVPGTLIVRYVEGVLVRSYIVPTSVLTNEDRLILAKVDMKKLPVHTSNTSVGKAKARNDLGVARHMFLTERMDSDWQKYRVQSKLKCRISVEINGNHYDINADERTQDADPVLQDAEHPEIEVNEICCFTEDT